MFLRQIFDPKLAQYSYLIGCRQSGEAIVVDPLRDIDRYLVMAAEEGLELIAAVETHIHADFLSGAREFAAQTRNRVYLSGEGGPDTGYRWIEQFNSGPTGAGITFVRHGDVIAIGSVEMRALYTPGHTPEHLSYLVTDRGAGASTPIGILSGDFVLVGDLGRPDLLEKVGGASGAREDSARALCRSLAEFTALADEIQLWPGHGAGSSCARAIGSVPTSTVGYEKRYNPSIAAADAGEDAFVAAILKDQPTPPTYYDRMKRDNRDGPPPLPSLAGPAELTAAELQRIVGERTALVIDTRPDRAEFMRCHLRGSLYAPFGRTFSAVIGSLVFEPERSIVLVIDADVVDVAVRDLVRIGCDHVVGRCSPSLLVESLNASGACREIPELRFDGVARLAAEKDARRRVVVDVRDYFEFEHGHVPGAINAPYSRLPELSAARIPAGHELIVHCESGIRSAVASAWLAAHGWDVLYVNDDWSAWTDAGRAVEYGNSVSE